MITNVNLIGFIIAIIVWSFIGVRVVNHLEVVEINWKFAIVALFCGPCAWLVEIIIIIGLSLARLWSVLKQIGYPLKRADELIMSLSEKLSFWINRSNKTRR
ncbi:MAG: hypothetical protein PVG39_25855 [Desulfobacteraceae bacterium]|jgi:hypothetical protein